MVNWLVWGHTVEQAINRARFVWNRHGTKEEADRAKQKEQYQYYGIGGGQHSSWRLFSITINELEQ